MIDQQFALAHLGVENIMKKTKWSLIAMILAAGFLAASLILPVTRGQSPIDLGLDLSGGVIVTYRLDFSSRLDTADDLSEAELLALAKETLASRLYRSLNTIPDVVVRSDQRIVVSLPSRGDDQRVLELVGKTYQLSFRLVMAGENAASDRAETYEYRGRHLRLAPAEFSGDMLDPRYLRVETGGLEPGEIPQATVTFRFQPPHDEAFARFTGDSVGRELAIMLDDEVEWAGRIESAIHGDGVLRGGYRIDEATEIAGLLRSGTLPVSLEVEGLTAVGPDLGQEIQELGVEALLLSLGLLLVVLVAGYLHRGSLLIVGVASLGCLLFLITGLVAAFSLTLDLVGIAGLVLSLGMGMDAFILIFEALEARPSAARRRPERRGWAIRRLYSFAAEGGTLFHANVTTLLVISLLLSTERLKSFALFIFVGILASVLTIFFTRRILRLVHGRVGRLGPDLFSWLRQRPTGGPKLGVFGWRKAYFALVAVALAVGLLFAAPGGVELGADFTAGTQVIATAPEESRVATALQELAQQLPDVDARRQVLGDPAENQHLVTLGTALVLEDRDDGRLSSERLLAIFDAQSVEVESVSSIDGKLSSRRLGTSLTVLIGSFFLLLIYFVALQGPIDRAFSPRRPSGPRMPASARLTVWSGVLAAVVLDVAVVLAVMALRGIEVNLPVIAGLLTILGYSVNDSVVLWEHIRRRWAEHRGKRSPAEVVTLAVDGILSRALLTSLSTLVPAMVILMVGLTPLLDFAWVMIAGVISGTLSSIFVVGSFAVRALGVCSDTRCRSTPQPARETATAPVR